MRAYIDRIESILAADRARFILPTPYFLFRKSIPVFDLPMRTKCPQGAGANFEYKHVQGYYAQPQGYRQRHARRPCGTGARRPRFVCKGQPKAAGVPPCVAPRARCRATSGEPAGRLAYLGAGGHGFFSRRFFPAMRRGLCFAGPSPCSSPGPGPTCMIVVSLQPGSIVTVLVSESVWGRYDRIFWFRSNPFPAAREPLCTGPQPTGPFVCCSLRVCHSTWRQAVQVPGRCGSRGSSPVCGSRFPGMRKARDWSRSVSLAPRATEHLGLRPGRGHFSVTAEKIWVFPSFGNSFGVPHPGTYLLACSPGGGFQPCGLIAPPPHKPWPVRWGVSPLQTGHGNAAMDGHLASPAL